MTSCSNLSCTTIMFCMCPAPMAKKTKSNHQKRGGNSTPTDDAHESTTSKKSIGRTKVSGRKNPSHKTIPDDRSFRLSIDSDGKRTINDMTGDGNCLFRSLSDQLFGDYGQRHDLVRGAICDCMSANKDDFVHFLVLDDTDAGAEEDAKSFEQYVQDMRRDGEWGGNVELVAASRLYQRNITVYHPGGAFSIDAPTKCGEEELTLSYHDNDHYNSVRVAGRKVTQPSVSGWTVATNCKNNKRTKSTVTGPNTKERTHQETESNEATISAQEEVVDDTEHSNSQSGGTQQPPQETSPEQKENLPAPRRNDVCSCGSGLKYKKCCLAQQKQQVKLAKWKEKHGLNIESGQVESSSEKTCLAEDMVTLDGGFRVLKI